MSNLKPVRLSKDQEQMLNIKIKYHSLQIVFWLQLILLFIGINYDWSQGIFFSIKFWIFICEIVIWFISQVILKKVITKRFYSELNSNKSKKQKNSDDEKAYEDKLKEKESIKSNLIEKHNN